jgi:hypothetical protein
VGATAAPGGVMPGPAAGGGGLFAALDVGFTRFVTPVVVRWLWIIYLILAPLGYLIVVVAALLGGGLVAGVTAIFVGAFVLILYTLLARVWLEMIAIFFRIAEYLREMSQKK